MTKSRRSPRESDILGAVKQHLRDLEDLIPSLSANAARKTRATIDEIRSDLLRSYGQLDPIREPTSLFDPTDPNTAGRLVALALLAQPRVPLDRIARTYGAGVYAIYYCGGHPFYSRISNTETPIYVGKADPKNSHARNAREQGDRLYGRLKDHRKVIRQAEAYAGEKAHKPALRIEDFECRRLVTATNAQLAAERHLIGLFRPVWNSDMKVCWGLSKHGDKEGRSNDRSPWFVVHPTEYWAVQTRLKDSRPRERIIKDIANHFDQSRIFKTRNEIVDEFLATFLQDPMISAKPVEDDAPDDETSEEGTK